jgi:hypothetical protein
LAVFFFTPSWSGQPAPHRTIFGRLPSLSFHGPTVQTSPVTSFQHGALSSQISASFFSLHAPIFALDCDPQYAVLIGFSRSLE